MYIVCSLSLSTSLSCVHALKTKACATCSTKFVAEPKRNQELIRCMRLLKEVSLTSGSNSGSSSGVPSPPPSHRPAASAPPLPVPVSAELGAVPICEMCDQRPVSKHCTDCKAAFVSDSCVVMIVM